MTLHRRAQLIAIDLFFAFIIISILLVAIFLTWNQYLVRLDERVQYSNMAIKAMQLADTFVKSPGYPLEWNSSNVEVIGLAIDDRQISTEKMNNFTNMTESSIKDIMKIENYDFYFTLKAFDGSINITHGSNITGKQSVAIRRYVIYENKSSELLFALWE